MRRTSGYGVRTQSHTKWEGDAVPERSQDEVTFHSNERAHNRSPSCRSGSIPPNEPTAASSDPRRARSNNPPRSDLPTRLPSALRTRSRSYSSSSVDSRSTAEDIPPLPQPSVAPGQIYPQRISREGNTNSSRSQSGLPRRSASISRSRSRSRNDIPKPSQPPPPLPVSSSDNEKDRPEQVLNQTSWAKDRRRFTPESGSSHVQSSRNEPPLEPVLPTRKTSSQIPNRSRIPSVLSKPTRNDQTGSSGGDSGARSSSRSSDKRKIEGSNVYSGSRLPEPNEVGDTSRSRRRYSTTEPRLKGEADVVRISSMQDMPLPVPPLPQTDLVLKNRSHSEEPAQPSVISSPLETMLMGSTPTASKRASTRRESASVPLTPGTRRLSEPSRTPAKDQTPKEQEATPGMWQRLARRASFSTGKSPKANNTPKNTENVESPFGLDTVTPRAGIDSKEPNVIQPESAQRRRSTSLSAGNGRKPRAKAVDSVAATQDEVKELGSPFMGAGSPRFGIDERFRSPRARSKSGLRHDIYRGLQEDDSQELLAYYSGEEAPNNTENYLIDETPIATVLSSPRDTSQNGPSTAVSPLPRRIAQSQHSYACRSEETSDLEDHSHAGYSRSNSQSRTPRAHTPSRPAASPKAPSTVRPGARSLSESSARPHFSEATKEQTSQTTFRERNVLPVPSSPAVSNSQHIQRRVQRPGDSGAYTQEPNQTRTNEPKLPPRMNPSSQLPVPKKRNTNSALFRALEQPYGSSSFASDTSVDLSASSSRADNQDSECVQFGPTDDSVDQLHTVSSNLSSLNGDGVGDIRWSGQYELSSATDVLLQNLGQSGVETSQPRVVVQAPTDEYASEDVEDEQRESIFSDDIEHQPDVYDRQYIQQPELLDRARRMSVQDKRKAIHESWRASFESDHLEADLDPLELERQQAIWEFHQSEESYVETLQIALQVFVRPLRAQNQRQWISGLASSVTKLFDWLDDIANLHDQILDALDALRQNNRSLLTGFSNTIRPFVPLMELYQPYVIRVEEVGKRIMSMVVDPDSDFGEFVRMQSSLPECNQMRLEELLAKPTERLQDYVDAFQRIFELTPREHPDYLATYALLHSMHAMTSIIQETKTREEEYHVIKGLLSQFRGLPTGFLIATRERRLLARGILQQVSLPEHFTLSRAGSKHRQSISNPTGRPRSSSQSTTISSATESTASSATHVREMASDSSATSYANMSRDGHKPSRVSFLPHAGSMPPPRNARSRSRATSELERPPSVESVDTYVLVFSDLVVLGRPLDQFHSPRHFGSREEWNAFDALGVFRVLAVTDCSGQYGFDRLVSLDLISIDDDKNDGTVVDAPVLLSIPRLKDANRSRSEIRPAAQDWLDALNICYLHSLRSWAFPTTSEGISHPGYGAPQHTSSSNSKLLRDSREFPKSPSQQLERETNLQKRGLPPVENVEEEREERAFWAERFRVVSEEMRVRYEGLPFAIDDRRAGRDVSQRKMTKTCRSSGVMI